MVALDREVQVLMMEAGYIFMVGEDFRGRPTKQIAHFVVCPKNEIVESP